MTPPGWYRDPSGQPGLRWWDGNAWTQHVQAAGANPSFAEPSIEGPRKSAGGLIAAVIAGVVVLALIGFLVVRAVGRADPTADPSINTETAAPTVSGWDETSSPTPSPTPTPTPTSSTSPTPLKLPPPVPCPTGDTFTRTDHPRDDRVYGGALSFEPAPGWEDFTAYGLTWAYDLAGVKKDIVPTWIAIAEVGALRVADGWESPRQSAEQMIQCIATSSYYQDITGQKGLLSEAITIDGHQGWRIKWEISVDRADEIPGDIVNIIVVDTGNEGSLSFYTDSATPNTDSVQEAEATLKTLRVE